MDIIPSDAEMLLTIAKLIEKVQACSSSMSDNAILSADMLFLGWYPESSDVNDN